MNDSTLFTIGFLIFLFYMIGLLRMINKQHKKQAEEHREKEFTDRDLK